MATDQWILGDELRGVGMLRAGPLLCEELRRDGIPVDRAHFLALLLHPLFHGRSYFWTPDRGVWVENHAHGMQDHPGWANSVFHRMSTGDLPDVYAVELGPEMDGSEPLPTLRAQGFTGYMAMSWLDSKGRQSAISLATRAEGGFSPHALERLRALRAPLALRSEIALSRDFVSKVLQTYLGEGPARRVLDGHIQRGHVEEIEAVIWFSDLRGFTRISEDLPPIEVTALLGEYFQAVSDVVQAEDGEILKFMGDGVLAVFPTTDRAVPDACDAAARAAERLIERLRHVDVRWKERGASCEAGVALHVGKVIYGNVGAADRLDFTVIGPAVNLTARMEGCGEAHGVHIVVSEAFSAKSNVPTRYLETGSFKGLRSPHRVFTLT